MQEDESHALNAKDSFVKTVIASCWDKITINSIEQGSINHFYWYILYENVLCYGNNMSTVVSMTVIMLLQSSDGETNVHGLQYDGYARTHPQQLLLFHSHSLHALRSQTGEYMHVFTWLHTHLCAHIHKCTHSSLKCCNLSFPLVCASKAVLLGLCGFHHLVCNQSCVWTCQCSTGDSGWNKGPFMWLWLGCPPTAWCIS